MTKLKTHANPTDINWTEIEMTDFKKQQREI